MWNKASITIVRDVDPKGLAPFDNADAEDGIMLNHNYVDMRGIDVAEAEALVEEEAALLNLIEKAGNDEDKVDRIIDELEDDMSELSAFDVGVAGAIYALSAAGAAPITSCNGGMMGDHHAFDYPNVLFSVGLEHLPLIVTAAERANVGLENASGHIMVYGKSIPQLNAFAVELIRLKKAHHKIL